MKKILDRNSIWRIKMNRRWEKKQRRKSPKNNFIKRESPRLVIKSAGTKVWLNFYFILKSDTASSGESEQYTFLKVILIKTDNARVAETCSQKIMRLRYNDITIRVKALLQLGWRSNDKWILKYFINFSSRLYQPFRNFTVQIFQNRIFFQLFIKILINCLLRIQVIFKTVSLQFFWSQISKEYFLKIFYK